MMLSEGLVWSDFIFCHISGFLLGVIFVLFLLICDES